MSIKYVEPEIKNFLKRKDPEVLCITGKWGVGKTFAWKEYLKSATQKGNVPLSRYAYVSLFGQNSLNDVKQAILDNTEVIGPALEKEETLKDVISKTTGRYARYVKYLGLIPNIGEHLLKNSLILFLTIQEQIICIDDLERHGENLDIKDILGLASFLKEERQCKVVLLLNEEELSEKKDFKVLLEKVADTEIQFSPEPEEAVEKGLDKSNPFYDQLSKICLDLKITNIRILRKIERLSKKLRRILEKNDERTFNASLTSLALFSLIKYDPNKSPSIDFVKNFSIYKIDLSEAKEKEEEKGWIALLRSLGFTHFDNIDGIIWEGVESGYFNEEKLKAAAKKLDTKLSKEDKNNSFNKAWDKYYYSFSCNEEEVLDNLFSSFKESVESITPDGLDGTVSLFKRFGREEQADEILSFYMEKRREDKDFYDPVRSRFLNLKDQSVSKAFSEKLASFKDDRSPEEILLKIVTQRGWNPDDILTLSKVSPNQFYETFKKIDGDNLITIVRQALEFEKITNADERMKSISSKAKEALVKIGKECEINRNRVRIYGVVVDKKSPRKKRKLNGKKDNIKNKKG